MGEESKALLIQREVQRLEVRARDGKGQVDGVGGARCAAQMPHKNLEV